jgi:1,4-dihydroxy-6-naphthoate synthase
MSRRVRIGISPCPNDTFVFCGLLRGSDHEPHYEIELADVEELNRRFAAGELDAAKCSFHAARTLGEAAVVLPAGAALGFGVGPILLARPGARALAADSRVLCPGEGTTAHLLLRRFHPAAKRVEHVVFSEILPRLARGEADYGVCIHEARFTFARHGLAQVEDLGATWERATGSPLPLGGILARRELGPVEITKLVAAIRGSLAFARANPAEALATMRLHAQELDDRVLWQHVELYVNRWTDELGEDGRDALRKLHELARDAGFAPVDGPPIEVFGARAEADQSP